MSQREHGDPLDALKAELATVTPSPEFQARVRQRIAGEMDLLREELAAVAPSVEFAARVRQGIDEARDRRAASWLSGWRWIVPIGAVAAGVIAIVALTHGGSDTPQQAVARAPVVVETPRPAVTPERPTPASKFDVGRSKLARSAKGAPVEASAVVANADPMLEVITNQPAILRAMRARLGAAEVVAEPTAPPSPNAIPDVVVAPIEVSPVVVKWMVEPPLPPGAPGVLPIIRRVTADTAERSPK